MYYEGFVKDYTLGLLFLSRFPPLTNGRRRHTKWLTAWFSKHQKLQTIISGNKTEEQAILDYDTSYHTAYDPYLQDTIERYDEC